MSRLALVALVCIIFYNFALYHLAATQPIHESGAINDRHNQQQQDNINNNDNLQSDNKRFIATSRLLDGQASHYSNNNNNNDNIDLTELTPTLESQLNQAKRLNEADSESALELDNQLAVSNNADSDRYELISTHDKLDGRSLSSSPPSGSMVSLVQDPTKATNWVNRARLNGVNTIRRRNNNNIERPFQINSQFLQRDASGSSAYKRSNLFNRQQQLSDQQQSLASHINNKDYDDLLVDSSQGGLAEVKNQESASRRSLWASDLLRDLLTAQESRNRARYLDQLARNYERERAKDPTSASGTGSKFDWWWNSNYKNNNNNNNLRDKRRGCKIDPYLGVKNPSRCDTDAYFGAADYGARDVWGDAGKR